MLLHSYGYRLTYIYTYTLGLIQLVLLSIQLPVIFLHQSGNRCIMKNAYHDLLKPKEMALIFSFKDHKFEVTIHLI